MSQLVLAMHIGGPSVKAGAPDVTNARLVGELISSRRRRRRRLGRSF